MPQEAATRERKASDLRPQLDGLGGSLAGEVVFLHIRTGRNPVTVYSMQDGEKIPVPEYMLRTVLSKALPDGTKMFTQNPDEAPEYHWGEVKCFLHAESAERTTGILQEIGLAGKVCEAGKLASIYSKRQHGEHRHSKEWAAYQEHVTEQKEAKQDERQEKQLAATLDLAKGAAPVEAESVEVTEPAEAPSPVESCDVEGCVGFEGTPNQVRGHKLGAHK